MEDLRVQLLAGGHERCTPRWSRGTQGVERVHRLYFPRRGEAHLDRAGRQHLLRPGTVALIPAGAPLAHRCDRFLELDWLHFRFVNPVLDSLAVSLRIDPAAQWKRWADVHRRLGELFSTPAPPDLEPRVQAMLLDRIAAPLRAAVPDDPAARHVERWRQALEPTRRWLDDRAMANPALEEASEIAAMSPSAFHCRFKEVYGLTPHAYVQRRRLDQAWRLLREDALEVKQAAARCGYGSPFYFSRAFRSHFGRPPSEVRAGLASRP